MTSEAVPLGVWDIVLAGGLVLVAGAVSFALRLGLERRLAVASLRTIIQLYVIGYVLRWLFATDQFPLVLFIAGIMTAVASHAALDRSSRRIRGVYTDTFIALVVSSFLTTSLVTGVIVGVDPWWNPRYAIPLFGMILGNGLTGISLCVDYLLESFSVRRHLVEMELAHGATAWEASREPIREGLRRGMIPIINSMMVVGIVSLPGMMTGQILAGADPVQAILYQIVVMFMLAAATSGACLLLAWFVQRRLFNDRHQLLWEKIRKR